MKRIPLTLGIVMLTALGSFAQSKVSETEWLLDIPTAPVRLTLAPRKDHLFFNNTSNGAVVEIRVGVVTTEKGVNKMLSARSFVKINEKLAAGDVQIAGIVGYLEDIDFAIDKKAKLAVVMVRFLDGSVWYVSDPVKS